MKAEFPGHFKLSDSEIKKIWQTGFFSFDANFLLNAYRYSNETRLEIFKIIENNRERIWIPHQAAFEFVSNRLIAIREALKSYEDVETSLKKNEETFKALRHPHIDGSLLNDFSEIVRKILKDLDARRSEILKLISNDSIQEELARLLEKRIGPAYDEDTLKRLYADAENRFKLKIPPGYRDEKKEVPRKYGDFIIWSQLIDHAKAEKKPLIFVTGDGKEDWWLEGVSGRTAGPRPELIEEMKKKADVRIHFYTPDKFLELARSELKQKVTKDAIAEARQVGEIDRFPFSMPQHIIDEICLISQHQNSAAGKLAAVANSHFKDLSDRMRTTGEALASHPLAVNDVFYHNLMRKALADWDQISKESGSNALTAADDESKPTK